MKRAEKQKEWEDKIALYRESKQSVRRWCKDNNESPDRLWYWLRKYRTDEYTAKNTASLKPNKWLPLEISEHLSEHDNALNVKIGKTHIEVKQSFDPILLSQVARVLVSLC